MSYLQIIPAASLGYETTYYVVIDNDGDNVITDLAGNEFAGIGEVDYSFTTEAAGTGTLGFFDITQINTDKSIATNTNDFDDGWEWYVSLTVPTNETRVRLQFTDFIGSDGSSIPATGDNIRYYSVGDTNSHTTEDTAVEITTVETYPTDDYLIFNAGSDLDSDTDGYQVVVKVQVKVPVASTGSGYSGQFKVESTVIPAS